MVDEVTEKLLELGRGRPLLSSRVLQPEEGIPLQICCKVQRGRHISDNHTS